MGNIAIVPFGMNLGRSYSPCPWRAGVRVGLVAWWRGCGCRGFPYHETNKTYKNHGFCYEENQWAMYRLSTGVQVWTRRGKSQLVVRIPQSDGRMETPFFEMSPEGVRLANRAVNQAATKVQTYGTAFGALSVAERQGVECYRAYVSECIEQGVPPIALLDVLAIGLK